MNAADLKIAAQRWYDAQLQRLAQLHGVHWAANRDWIDAYLRAELKQRLLANGWRPQ